MAEEGFASAREAREYWRIEAEVRTHKDGSPCLNPRFPCVHRDHGNVPIDDFVEATWNKAYPDRRPWSEIGAEAQAEWRRVFAIYDSLRHGTL
jgi:hypothetical protein